jgi:hypothetical protein
MKARYNIRFDAISAARRRRVWIDEPLMRHRFCIDDLWIANLIARFSLPYFDGIHTPLVA